jgi:hypothetical protein
MSETQNVQEPTSPSTTNQIASNSSTVGKLVQSKSFYQQQSQIYQEPQKNTQQTVPSSPLDTQTNYLQPPSGPYDYEQKQKPPNSTLPRSAQTPLQAYKEYIKFRIRYDAKKGLWLKLAHNILQTIILIGAALISISIGFPHAPSWLPSLIGGIVTIATAIANYYKFGDQSQNCYRSAVDMQQEYNWFKSNRGPYKELGDMESFELFQDRIDALKREQFLHQSAFENQQED